MSLSEICNLISCETDVPLEIAAIIEGYAYAEGELRFLQACRVLHRRCYAPLYPLKTNRPRELEYSCAAEHVYDHYCMAHLKILPADDFGFRIVTGVEIHPDDCHSCDPLTPEIDRYVSDIELAAWIFGNVESIPSLEGPKYRVEEKLWGELRKEIQEDFSAALEPQPRLNLKFVVKLVVLRCRQQQNPWHDINVLCAHNELTPTEIVSKPSRLLVIT